MKTNNKTYTVITGASMGLGKAFAMNCAARNMNLILLALENEGVVELASALQQTYGIIAHCIETDLTKDENLQNSIQYINSNFKINMLINNAGIGGSNPFGYVNKNYIDHILLLNIKALVLFTHGLLKNLESNNESYILNIASMASFSPMPYKTVYPASKAFVYSFSRGLAAELRGTGITVSVAHPGGMATNPGVSERIAKYNGLIRFTILSPEKTASICIRQLLKKDQLIIPGLMNKISWMLFKIVPVWMRLPIMKRTLEREIKPKNSISYA